MNKYLISGIAKNAIQGKKNYIAVITASAGMGKNECALAIYEDIVGEDKVRAKNICFTSEEFTHLLESGLEDGDVAILMDAGVTVPRKDNDVAFNKILGLIEQRYKSTNIVVIFTTPNLGFVNPREYKRLNAVISILDMHKNALFREFVYNEEQKETMLQYPYFLSNEKIVRLKPTTKGGGNMRFERVQSRFLSDAYRAKQKILLDTLREVMKQSCDPPIAKELVEYLQTDGAHHKQYALERALEHIVGAGRYNEIRKSLEEKGEAWEEGIP